jgi:hypothetical protein
VLKSGDEIADSVKRMDDRSQRVSSNLEMEDWLFGWREKKKKKVELGVRPI